MCSCRWWQAPNGGAITSEADALLLLGETDRAIARRRGLPGASPMLARRSTRTEGSRVGAPPASAMASEDIMVLMTMAMPIVGDVTREASYDDRGETTTKGLLMTLDEAKKLVAKVPHWHHAFEIYPGVVTPGSYDPDFLLEKMRLPPNLKGSRVLDVGTSDGFFTLRLAQRGGEVVAVDYRGKREHGYYVTEELNELSVNYYQMNVYDINPRQLGYFDIILFMGVLYHLPDMIKGLHAVRQCCSGTLFVETHSENEFCPDVAAARYYQGATLANDHTNFWAPNRLCVMDMLYDYGLRRSSGRSLERSTFCGGESSRDGRLTEAEDATWLSPNRRNIAKAMPARLVANPGNPQQWHFDDLCHQQ